MAAEADVSLAGREVSADAARAFFRVAIAQISVAAATDILEGLDSLVRYSSARVAEGAAAEGDLIRLRVERDRAATDRVLQQVEVTRAGAMLAAFIDDPARRSSRPNLVVMVDDSSFAIGSALAAESVFTARARFRPDVLAAKARARAAQAETGLQRRLLVRQFGATFGTKSTAGEYSMIAGLSLPFPLFDQNRGEVQRATGERLAAERELAWAERRASAEVAGAYEAARLLLAQVAVLERGFLQRAAEARRIAVAAYQEGAAPLLQVIDATRTLADARVSYYRALFARQEGLLELYSTAGLDPLGALTLTPPPTLPPTDGGPLAIDESRGKN